MINHLFSKINNQAGLELVFENLPLNYKLDHDFWNELSWLLATAGQNSVPTVQNIFERTAETNVKRLALLTLEKILTPAELVPYLKQSLIYLTTLSNTGADRFLVNWQQAVNRLDDIAANEKILG